MVVSQVDQGHINDIVDQAEVNRNAAVEAFKTAIKTDPTPAGVAKAASDLKMALGAAEAGFNSAKEIADFVKQILGRVTGS